MRDALLLSRRTGRLAILRALLWREWRDVRGVSLFCFALLPVAAWAIQALLVHYAYPGTTASELVPVVVLLYGLLQAGDLLSREIESDRLAGLAALPVGLGWVWAAKVLLLAAQLVAFAGWTVAVHWLLFAVGGKDVATRHFAEGLVLAAESAPLVAACVAATLLYSTLWRRGLAAIVCGVATAWGLAAATATLDLWRTTDDPLRLPAAGLAVLLLVAAAVTFVLGRPHHAPRRRRIGVAACVTLVGLTLTSAPVLARLGTTAAPAATTASRIQMLHHAGPDGRFVLSLLVPPSWERATDHATPRNARVLVGRNRTFLFDPATERLTGPLGGTWNHWTGHESGVVEDWVGFRRFDPAAGASRRIPRREAERLRRSAAARPPVAPEMTPPWWQGGGVEHYRRRGDQASWTVRWLERGIERTFADKRAVTVITAVPGRVLVQQPEGRWEFVDLESDRRTVLYEPRDGGRARVTHVGDVLLRVSPRDGEPDRLHSVHDARPVGPLIESFRSCLVTSESAIDVLVSDTASGTVWRVVPDDSAASRVRLERVRALDGHTPTYAIDHANGLYFLDEEQTALWLLEPGAERPRAVLRVGEESQR